MSAVEEVVRLTLQYWAEGADEGPAWYGELEGEPDFIDTLKAAADELGIPIPKDPYTYH